MTGDAWQSLERALWGHEGNEVHLDGYLLRRLMDEFVELERANASLRARVAELEPEAARWEWYAGPLRRRVVRAVPHAARRRRDDAHPGGDRQGGPRGRGGHMAELTTRDGVRVAPGTELYWLEPGTTQVLGSPTYTRDVAMTRWSSPAAAIAAARDHAEGLKAGARAQYEAGYKRWNRYDDFQRMCVTLLDAIEYTGGVEVTAVPPADKPEECR